MRPPVKPMRPPGCAQKYKGQHAWPTCSSPKILRPPSQHSSLWPPVRKKGPPLCMYPSTTQKPRCCVAQPGRRVQNRAQHYFICPSLARFKIQLELFAFRHVFSGLILLWSGKSRVFKIPTFWLPDSLAVVHINELLINNYIA